MITHTIFCVTGEDFGETRSESFFTDRFRLLKLLFLFVWSKRWCFVTKSPRKSQTQISQLQTRSVHSLWLGQPAGKLGLCAPLASAAPVTHPAVSHALVPVSVFAVPSSWVPFLTQLKHHSFWEASLVHLVPASWGWSVLAWHLIQDWIWALIRFGCNFSFTCECELLEPLTSVEAPSRSKVNACYDLHLWFLNSDFIRITWKVLKKYRIPRDSDLIVLE